MLATQPKCFLHSDRIIIRNQFAIDKVVASLRTIDPLSLLHGAFVTHLHVFRKLLAEVLRERSKDVVEHSTGCRTKIERLIDGMKGDIIDAEEVREQDQVLEISRQPIQSPHDHMRDVSSLHSGE